MQIYYTKDRSYITEVKTDEEILADSVKIDSILNNNNSNAKEKFTEIHYNWRKQIIINSLAIDSVSKEQIIAQFDNPLQTTQPDYDCGFLSSSENETTFYSLQYKGFWFTGNKDKNYIVEEIDFLQFEPSIIVTTNGKKVSKNTNIVAIEAILSTKLMQNKDNEIILTAVAADADNYHLVFKNNMLCKMYYWSPC